MEKIDNIFDSEFLRKIEQLRIDCRKLMSSNGNGNRKSRSKGSSVEFSDYREYAAGDDFRRIDWNAYGKFEKLFLKLFTEEREARINIFLDTSGSMDWGEPHKGIQGKRLAAALAYIGLSNFDRVSVYSVNEQLHSSRKSIHGKDAFWQVLRYLNDLPFEGVTNLSRAIKTFDGSGGAGISILISDLMSFDDVKDGLKYLQYKKQDIILCQLLSPEELHPSIGGSVRLLDVETGEAKDITVSHRLIKAYQNVLDGFKDDIKKYCFKRGIRYIELSSEISMESMVKMTIGAKQ
ncbi:DUF58 domain-containing protein [Petroclostridium sp. X23]|uniref:DUF58 domain-containing protein n=1 Tax=Petroclostridium sp. X23 TaxID=3045146 RepID=UPI0024AD8984|nr:DUF58 domain-containing protein [Petroclostridium sp. X23]WHH59613.1 DUF58 domain-containing protein [Petroclostridium sp. X23]